MRETPRKFLPGSLQLVNSDFLCVAYNIFSFWDSYFENTVIKVRLHFVCVSSLRQLKPPAEAAMKPLQAVAGAAFNFLFQLLLTRDCQHIVSNIDRDIFLLDSRQISLEHQLVAVYEHINRRRKGPRFCKTTSGQ